MWGFFLFYMISMLNTLHSRPFASIRVHSRPFASIDYVKLRLDRVSFAIDKDSLKLI